MLVIQCPKCKEIEQVHFEYDMEEAKKGKAKIKVYCGNCAHEGQLNDFSMVDCDDRKDLDNAIENENRIGIKTGKNL